MSFSTCTLRIPSPYELLSVAELTEFSRFCCSSDYTSPNPQRGLCLAPERASDVGSTEIVKAYKAAGTTIEPISFVVPRKVSPSYVLQASQISAYIFSYAL